MAGKKFRFSLEPVLKLRRHVAERAEMDLAGALRIRSDQQAEFDAADSAVKSFAEDAPVRHLRTPASFRRLAAMQQEVFRARAEARVALEAAQHRATKARVALLAARKPEEALHTLRAREEATHRSNRLRTELAALDDQATAAYCRQLQGGG